MENYNSTNNSKLNEIDEIISQYEDQNNYNDMIKQSSLDEQVNQEIKYNEQDNQSQNNLVDFHIHTNTSLDGIHTINEIVERAKNHNVKTIAITDHNTCEGISKFMDQNGYPKNAVMCKYKDIEIFCGAEVTIKAKKIINTSGNASKFHILCYGFDRSQNSPIMKLLELKRQNDIDNDLSYFLFLAHNYHYRFNWDELKKVALEKRMQDPEFQEFNKNDVIEYLDQKQYNFFKNKRELIFALKKCPQPQRLNIDLEDLVKIVHASGGVCLVAHPTINVMRTQNNTDAIYKLVRSGLDGYERLICPVSHNINVKFKKAFKDLNKKPLISAGSDFHTKTSMYKVGQYANNDLVETDYTKFINQIKKRNLNVQYETNDEIKAILKKYQDRFNEISKEFKESSNHLFQDNMFDKQKLDEQQKYIDNRIKYVSDPNNYDKLSEKDKKFLKTINEKKNNHQDETIIH